MARQRTLINAKIGREKNGTIHGALTLCFEATDREKLEALNDLLRHAITVATHWHLVPQLQEACRAIQQLK